MASEYDISMFYIWQEMHSSIQYSGGNSILFLVLTTLQDIERQ